MAFWNRNRRKKYIVVAKDNWHYDYTIEALARHFNYSYDDLLRTIFCTGITELEKRMQEERTTFPLSEPSVVLRSSMPPPSLPPEAAPTKRAKRLRQNGRKEAKASVYGIRSLAFPASFSRYLLDNGWYWCLLQRESADVFLVFSKKELPNSRHVSVNVRKGTTVRSAAIFGGRLVADLHKFFSRNGTATLHLNLGRNISLNKDALRFKIELEK